METLENFIGAFLDRGDKPTDNNQLELGYEKVAIYVNANGTPTHMARQRIRVVDEQARKVIVLE